MRSVYIYIYRMKEEKTIFKINLKQLLFNTSGRKGVFPYHGKDYFFDSI